VVCSSCSSCSLDRVGDDVGDRHGELTSIGGTAFSWSLVSQEGVGADQPTGGVSRSRRDDSPRRRKWTSGALFTKHDQLTSHGRAALNQVESNTEKIRRVLEQEGYAQGVDGCMVVVWGKKVPGCPFRVPGRRASIIDGEQLGKYLTSKPTRLSPSEVDEGAAALQSWLGPRRERIAAEAKRKLVSS
jgi:hypothetical protein